MNATTLIVGDSAMLKYFNTRVKDGWMNIQTHFLNAISRPLPQVDKKIPKIQNSCRL